MRFADRDDAGRQLARLVLQRRPDLAEAASPAPTLVLGLPRGGVVLAAEVARSLLAPLDVVVVAKIGHPENPEAAIGAVDPVGRAVFLPALRDRWLGEAELEQAAHRARATWTERHAALRGDRPAPAVSGQRVVLVDDGIATGATARVALEWLRRAGAAELILTVPVGPAGFERRFARLADQIICLYTDADFRAVGQFYASFRQVTDAEVVRLLAQAPRGAQN